MKRKKNWWIIPVVILLLITASAGGFFAGRNTARSEYQKEKERDILIHRSDLEGLGEITGTIYVTGHKSPDSDSIGSSIGYAALLQQLGYDARPVVLGKINNETKYILEAAGVEVPELMEDASGCNMILVDHSEYTHSAEGLEDANIISIIDHHGDGNVTTGNQLIYDARPLGSTATIIWTRYRDYGVEPDEKTAYVMLGSLLSDTRNLQSLTTTDADREALEDLSAKAGVSNTNAMYQEMFKASISYEGMTDEEIFYSDYKEFETGGTKYAIACVEAYDHEDAEKMSVRMEKVIHSAISSTGMDMAFAQINVFRDDVSMTFLVPSDEAASEVVESCFGDTAEFDGVAYILNPGISRKQVLVPAITEVLNAHPKE